MQQQFLDAAALHGLFSGGYRSLKKNMQAVNDLNVFPVPDGDTGTNMVHTFGGGLKGVDPQTDSVSDYMQQLSRAVLLSARGNSGVIFSQFFHGLYRGFAGKDTVCFADFSPAFDCAVEDAYASIITPTEGTILTVIREGADFLRTYSGCDLQEGFSALLEQMKRTLARTPDMLPVLKEAGVVDSGGAGLVCFIEGICAQLRGEDIEDTPELTELVSHTTGAAFGPDSELEYGYCTEFVLQLMHRKTDLSAFDLKGFTAPLEAMGDSIVAVHNDGIVKLHIHTFTPEDALGYARKFGEFLSVKIENMSVQHSETQTAPQRQKVKYAIVAVASGQGIIDYFYDIGAHAVIDGGQTCNPSVDDFLETFRRFNAEHIVVLPDNTNIILPAQQAAQLYTEADVRVIPTASVVEGYSALSMMNPWCDSVEDLIEDMSAGLDNVVSAAVTAAIRDARVDGMDVTQGQYMGLSGKHLLVTGNTALSTAAELIRTVVAQEHKDVIIVFWGSSVTQADADRLQAMLEAEFPLADLGFVEGRQDIYDFIISLE